MDSASQHKVKLPPFAVKTGEVSVREYLNWIWGKTDEKFQKVKMGGQLLLDNDVLHEGDEIDLLKR